MGNDIFSFLKKETVSKISVAFVELKQMIILGIKSFSSLWN